MSHAPSRVRWRAGVLGALVAFAWAASAGGADAYSENAVKAVFLSRFEGYVEWPPPPKSPFTIAVLGDDGVAMELQRLLPALHVGPIPAQVRKIRRVTDIGDASILYVGRESQTDLRLIASATAGRPILLVSDDVNGLDAGSAINFLLVDQRVRFEVSVLAAERAGLRISSDLLSVAARVQGGRRQSDTTCGATGSAACAPRVAVEVTAGGSRAVSPGAAGPTPVNPRDAESRP